MQVIVKDHNKKIKINLKKTGLFTRGSGLMFRTKNTDNLLFEFGKDVRISITSFFVFFPFLAIWLDKNNNVVDKKIVKPFILSIKPRNKFRKIIEVPLRENTEDIIKFFLGKGERFK